MLKKIFYIICLACLCTDVWATPEMAQKTRSKKPSSGKPSRQTKPNDMCANQLYAAFRLGVGVPLGMGKKSDNPEEGSLGFSDVAQKGFYGLLDAIWMQSNMLGIGGEVGFMNNPYKEQYWNNLNTRGTFDAKYQDVWLMATGRLFFGSARVKPCLGILAGAHLLHNMVDFDSKWQGSQQDESIKYTSNRISPGYGFEASVITKMSRGSFVSLAVRLNMVPRLDSEVLTIVDEYTFQERKIKINPHGNQNHLSIVLGIHFGTNSRYR